MKELFVLKSLCVLFMHNLLTIWCENIAGNVSQTLNVTNDAFSIDNENCIYNETDMSNNVTCLNVYNNDTFRLQDFGVGIINALTKKFPIAFQVQQDVNITKENEMAEQIVEENDVVEIYYDIIDDDDSPIDEYKIEIEMLTQFKKYIEKSGRRGLKNLAYKVKNLVAPTLYLNHILKNPKYFGGMERYFQFITQRKICNEIDHQFIFLDVLETSVKLFARASEEMCSTIVQETNATLSLEQIDVIEEIISLTVFNEKKEACNFICNNTYICRRFPAYSDYVAKVLKSVLKLKEKYLEIVINILDDAIRSKIEFLSSVMDDDIFINITLALGSMVGNSEDIRPLTTTAIKTIMQRYKVYYINGIEVDNKMKATRIIFDIIDVTFQIFDENVIETEFLRLIENINKWGRGKKLNMEIVLARFLSEALDFLEISWNREIRDEVKVLVQYMVKETSGNEELREKLFTSGPTIASGDHVIYSEKKADVI